MEDAFIAIVEEARAEATGTPARPAMSRHDDTSHADRGTRRRQGPAPAALIRKEAVQVLRDPSSIAIGMVLPVILILLFGYGLSLDVKNVPVAVVVEDPSPDAAELAAGFQLSPYFNVRAADLHGRRRRS